MPARKSLEVTTDAGGAFEFDVGPEVGLPFGSYLVAAHPGHLAGVLDLPVDPLQWPSKVEIDIEVAGAVSVEVVDSGGGRVSAATIHHAARSRSRSATAVQLHERYLEQEAITDTSGHADLAALPGEQEIWAEHEGLVSRPWHGTSPSQVILTLGESFTVGGTISYPDRAEWQSSYEGERRILVSGQVGGLWRPLAALRDVVEGEWGPERIPLEGVQSVRIRLEGAPISPIERTFDPPRPNTHQRQDFVAEKLEHLWFLVHDEAGMPIPLATVLVWWSQSDQPTEGKTAEGATRENGYAWVGTFPSGHVYYRVSAPGYGFFEGEELVPSENSIEIVLQRAGRVAGKCLREGQPVSDFELIYWLERNPRVYRRQVFLGREDGTFVIDGLTVGDWFVHASCAFHPGGKPIPFTVSPATEAQVEIHVPSGIRGGGRVIDALTGDPLPAARIQLFSSGGMEKSFPWGPPLATGPDGSFASDAFVLGTNYLTAEADGFAPLEVSVSATQQDFLDFGDIGLQRPQALQVTLLGLRALGALSPTELRAFTAVGHILPETPFDADGTVRFDAVPPGDHALVIRYPDGSWARLNLRLDPGKDWNFTFDLEGYRRLDLQVLDAAGGPIAFEGMVLVLGQEDTGLFVARLSLPSEDGHFRFEGIRAEQVQVIVYRQVDGTTVASRDLAFAGSSELATEIRLEDNPIRVRVVDADGAPLVGAWVRFWSVAGQFRGKEGTGADGWCSILGVPEEPALVDVNHGIAGQRHGIPVDASIREHELVLDARGSLELRLVDGEQPLAAVAARIVTAGGVTLTEAVQTDAQGLVRFKPLGEGAYRIAFLRGDCWPAVVERTLAPAEHAHLDVQMRRLAELELTLFDRQGLPVSGAEVELSSIEFGCTVAAWLREEKVRAPNGSSTDSGGVLRVGGLPRGAYAWSVTVGDQLVRGTFELQPGAPNRIPIRLGL